MKKGENMWVVLVVVLALVIFGFWALNKGSAPAPVVDNTTPPAAPTGTTGLTSDTTPSVEDTSTGSVNAGAPAASLSYQAALLKYKDARLQLDKNCQASPDKMTFKNNALMMIDNRAPVSRTVKVGTSFPVAAYGFKIIKLSSASLPATWKVDCGALQNVSTILIEK